MTFIHRVSWKVTSFILFFLVLSLKAETMRVSDDITIDFDKGGGGRIKVKGVPYEDSFFLEKHSRTVSENESLTAISGGYCAKGTVSSRITDGKSKAVSFKKMFNYEVNYTLQEDKSLLIHADITYLNNATNAWPNFGYISPLGGYNQNKKWTDLTKGGAIELVSLSGTKRLIPIFSEQFQIIFDMKRYYLKRFYLFVTLEAGKDSKMGVTDGRNETDNIHIGTRVTTSKAPTNFISHFVVREGQKESFECTLKLEKNNESPPPLVTGAPDPDLKHGIISSVDASSRTLVIKDDSDSQEYTLKLDGKSKISLNKSSAAFTLIQSGMKADWSVGDEPDVIKVLDVSSK
jgi:hypothetical protein